jgi:small subunit ribosomal protein S17
MADSEEVKQERRLRKVLTGTVVSDKQDKTLVVTVDRRSPHPLYRKVVKTTSRCYVHDENNEAKVGDVIEIMETRPLSKMKRWRLVSIIQRGVSD